MKYFKRLNKSPIFLSPTKENKCHITCQLDTHSSAAFIHDPRAASISRLNPSCIFVTPCGEKNASLPPRLPHPRNHPPRPHRLGFCLQDSTPPLPAPDRPCHQRICNSQPRLHLCHYSPSSIGQERTPVASLFLAPLSLCQRGRAHRLCFPHLQTSNHQ